MTVRKTTEVEIREGSVMETSEDEVYAAATDTAKAFTEETSAAISVLLRWLGLHFINLKLKESEDYGKKTAETRAANVRGKEGLGRFEVRFAAIETPHDESPREDAFTCVH